MSHSPVRGDVAGVSAERQRAEQVRLRIKRQLARDAVHAAPEHRVASRQVPLIELETDARPEWGRHPGAVVTQVDRIEDDHS